MLKLPLHGIARTAELSRYRRTAEPTFSDKLPKPLYTLRRPVARSGPATK
jgi:hypothetical protein